MRKTLHHSELGNIRKLDIPRSGVVISLVSDAELAGLITYLAAAPKQAESSRILTLLEAMLELSEIEFPAWAEEIDGPMLVKRKGRMVPNPVLSEVAPQKYQRQLRIDELQAVVDHELDRFRFRPFAHRLLGIGRWNVMWRVSPQKPPQVIHGVMQMDAGTALQLILDLARAGQLTRLRRCSCCQKWFYAGISHRKFCSTKCQQKHYARSEEWRTKRRLYMRDYRQQTMAPRSTRRK